MNHIKVSVIVPVYNGEAFLRRSIESLVNQTLEEIEIILINDGSTDNTQQIIDELLKKYPDSIKTKTTKNQGAGLSRNVGLDMATGEYIGFFDADDFADKTMFEKLYNKAKETEADICVCSYYISTERSLRSFQNGNMEYYGKSIYDSKDIFVYGVPYLWNKIFSRSMIEENSIRFHDFRIFEDLEFTYRLYFLANTIEKVDEPLYYYMRLNEQSLTAKFTDKFFDILKAMKSLIKFCKDRGIYEEFEDYLLFVCLNHMYLRMNMQVERKDRALKHKYIDECFAFLDEHFPNWKSHSYYFENKERNQKRYVSVSYWKWLDVFMKTSKRMRRISKKVFRLAKQIIKKNTGGTYIKYAKDPIWQKAVLLDSQHGNDINGNMFYLLKELQETAYADFDVYVTVDPIRKEEFEKKIKFYGFSRCKLVVMNSNAYLKALACCKYLFNDTSFPVYFIKRKEQIYFNTWHGTPLKTLGKKTQLDFYNIGNLQKNFNCADYLLYPSVYMMNHMIEDYMLANISHNKIALLGYPRNAIFFDTKRAEKVRKENNLSDKEVFVYMPTWRGTLKDVDGTDYVDELMVMLETIDQALTDKQVLYLNVHPYVKDAVSISGFKHIFMFPKEYETYDFLNVADCLITDYSSVFFDFACTQKRILLFAYDKEEYMKERGLYIDFDSLPFEMVQTTQDLIKAMNEPKDVDLSDFLQTYNAYDAIDVNERILNQLLFDQKDQFITLDMPNDHRDNVLCVVNDLSSYFLNKAFYRLANNSNRARSHFYVTFINANLWKHKMELRKLPEGISYYGQLYNHVCASFMQRVALFMMMKIKSMIVLFEKTYKTIFGLEINRVFNDIDFSKVLVIGERKRRRLYMFGCMPGKKILYFPKFREFNHDIHPSIYNMYDRIVVEDKELYASLSKQFDHVVYIEQAYSLDELMRL